MALVNGQGYDFASITVSLLGNPVVFGFKAISYGKTRAKMNSKGAQGEPVERTRGDADYTGSISLTLKEVKRIREAAGKQSLVDIPPFNISVSFANGVDPVTVDILQSCEFTEDTTASSSGDTEVIIVLPLLPGGILYNQ